jgi:hypothetical protein
MQPCVGVLVSTTLDYPGIPARIQLPLVGRTGPLSEISHASQCAPSCTENDVNECILVWWSG